MFNILDRYIARQVLASTFLMLFLLVMLRSLFSLLDELADLGRGTYQLADALLYVALMLPDRLLEFFPMSVLIGALASLGTMAANSELTVMRAAGITTWRIAGSTIKASILLMLVVVIVGEALAPVTTRAAQQLRTGAISGGELSVSKSGIWARSQNQVIQIGNLLADGGLSQVTIYQLTPELKLESLIKAKNAVLEGNSWYLTDGSETIFESNSVTNNVFDRRDWINPLDNQQLETLAEDPESLNLIGLLDYISYLEKNAMQSQTYQLAAWRKLAQPLAIAVMMFVAVSFVFGPMRNVTMGARVLTGVMLGFAFHLVDQSFGPVSLVFSFWPWLGALFPLMVFSLFGYWLMKRNS